MDRPEISGHEQNLRKWALELTRGDIDWARRLVEFVLGASDGSTVEKVERVLREAGLK